MSGDSQESVDGASFQDTDSFLRLLICWVIHDSISKAYTQALGLKLLYIQVYNSLVWLCCVQFGIFPAYAILLQAILLYKENSYFTLFIQEREIKIVYLKIIII